MNGYVPLNQTQQKYARLNWLATAGFFPICAFTMLNLNFFTRTFLQTEQVLSIFYLAACLTVLFSLKFPITKSIGGVGMLWMFSIALYLIISTRFAIGVDSKFFTSPASDVYRILTAQLITIAAAIGARHLLFAGKLQITLRILFGFTLLAGLSIILSKVIPALAPRADATGAGRVGGVFTDANAAGHALCYSAAFGFACVIQEKSFVIRVLIFGGLALLIPCLLLTNSRSSILFMGLLVLSQVFASPLLKQKGTLIAILVLGIGMPIGIGVAINKQKSHVNARDAANVEGQKDRLASFGRILRGEMDERDTGHRFVVGAVGIRYFVSSPVIGVGFYKLCNMPEVNLGCHNTFIRVFGEGGLFSGLVFMAAVGFICLVGWKCKTPEIRCLVLGFMLSYACSGMVSHSQLTSRISNVSLGICLGLMSGAATLQLAEEKKKRMVLRQRQHQQAAAAIPSSVTITG